MAPPGRQAVSDLDVFKVHAGACANSSGPSRHAVQAFSQRSRRTVAEDMNALRMVGPSDFDFVACSKKLNVRLNLKFTANSHREI